MSSMISMNKKTKIVLEYFKKCFYNAASDFYTTLTSKR